MLGERVQLVGDDLFVTNVRRLSRGIDEGVGNSILVKVNQIGTLSETIDAVSMAHRCGLHIGDESPQRRKPRTPPLPIWPWRLNTGQIKTGSASRSDRIAKYNQLLRIEEELGSNAQYLGVAFR